uniref:Helix-hairpin-helix domain-containing protein n=1 Tax=Prevotella sp. GTC17262 TaxID=3236797 RepID=A0AB33JL28_9BACT
MRWRAFFYFQKSDRKVFLTILTIVIVALGLYLLIDEEEVTRQTVRGREVRKSVVQKPVKYCAQPRQTAERFAFDPNTADSTQLLRLGLQPWQVRTIYRYRAKGGIYRQPEDFARLYGLTKGQYESLRPYIVIGEDYQPAERFYGHDRRVDLPERPDTLPRRYPVKLKLGEHVVLNMADTSMLKRVPGVGSYYAREIVNYGRRLGGFAHVGQLKEIEGFPSEALPYFKVEGGSVKKLNLNKMTLSELRRHPYINFYQARDITDYRRLKGPLKSADDLRHLQSFSAAAIERLRPYVGF